MKFITTTVNIAVPDHLSDETTKLVHKEIEDYTAKGGIGVFLDCPDEVYDWDMIESILVIMANVQEQIEYLSLRDHQVEVTAEEQPGTAIPPVFDIEDILGEGA